VTIRTGLLLVLWAAGASPLRAGTRAWTPSGPPGRVVAVAADPAPPGAPASSSSTLYAVTPAGFFSSPDLGRTWILVDASMAPPVVRAIAADPSVPGRITAVGCGAFRSEDAGKTWGSIARGLPSGCPLERLDADAYRSDSLFASGPDGLFVSDRDDTGIVWRASGQGLFAGRVIVSAHPYSRYGVGKIYAAPQEGGFFVSPDRGLTWAATPGGPDGAKIRGIQASETFLLVATDRGFYSSGNEGITWDAAFPPVPGGAVSQFLFTGFVSYVPQDTGVLRGSNGTWTSFSDGLPANTAISRLFAEPHGRSLCAIPATGEGTFTYRYGDPSVRLTSATGTVVVGRYPDLDLQITPEQPEPLPLTVESSDPDSLDAPPNLSAWALQTDFGSPVSVLRAVDHLVTVRVRVAEELGGSETAATVRVLNPIPRSLFLAPQTVPVGGPSFTLQVFADAFVEGSTILWNGQPRQTSIRSGGICPDICPVWLEAVISAEDVSVPGTAMISIRTPPPGGGTSESVALKIDRSARPPILRAPPPPRARRIDPRR
jgi:hypothetical protein